MAMVGISNLIQTMGAIVIFSLILLTANRLILSNSQAEIQTEAERIAIGLAQSIIKEAQAKPFDVNTADGTIPAILPEGFSSCGPASPSAPRGSYNDYDDYDGYNTNVDTELGDKTFTLEVAVSYVTPPDYDISSGSKTNETFFKKMVVTVSGDYLEDEIKLAYLRRYYKTTN